MLGNLVGSSDGANETSKTRRVRLGINIGERCDDTFSRVYRECDYDMGWYLRGDIAEKTPVCLEVELKEALAKGDSVVRIGEDQICVTSEVHPMMLKKNLWTVLCMAQSRREWGRPTWKEFFGEKRVEASDQSNRSKIEL